MQQTRLNSWPQSGPLNSDTHHREREGARDLNRTRVYERYSTWSGGRKIENEIARVRQIDPLIMDRPLEMPNGSEASKPILSDVMR